MLLIAKKKGGGEGESEVGAKEREKTGNLAAVTFDWAYLCKNSKG